MMSLGNPLLLLLPTTVTALYKCPAPKNPTPPKFLGSWGVGFLPGHPTSINYLTENAFWAPSTPGDIVDTYFCFTDTEVDANNTNKLRVTIGRGDTTTSCGAPRRAATELLAYPRA